MAEIAVEPIENYGLSKKDKPKAQFAKVGLVGCGNAGQKIALLISASGIEVIFIELNDEKIKLAIAEMNDDLSARIEHWGMTEGEKRAIMSRIKGSLQYEELKECDLVIESVLTRNREKSKDIRKEIFKSIEKHVNKDCIIATNSTTMVITEFASELENKHRCVSLHISTTAPDANLVEVVRSLYTSDEVWKNVEKFITLINKLALPVAESPGLVTVRLFVSLISEACETLMEGVASMENIDFAMRNGIGLPLGPFEMADKIGLDKVMRWMENIYEEFGDHKYKPHPMIKRLVRANHLGRRTNQGFYKYNDHGEKC